MGYWSQNERGESFSQTTGIEMLWGDAPADIMGKAILEIIAVFQRDKGRLPTEAEIRAGLLFSLRAAMRFGPLDPPLVSEEPVSC